jgi:hypothetical protein
MENKEVQALTENEQSDSLYKNIGEGNLTKIKELVDQGISLVSNIFLPTYLSHAAQLGKKEIVEWLILQGMDVNEIN